jgi:hypothetical protein
MIALLLIFVIFAGGVVVQMAQEVNSVHNDGVSNRALVAADAGIRASIVAVEEAISKGGPLPGVVAYTYPEAIGGTSVSYSANIGGQWDSLSGGGNRYYLINSTGTVNDGHEFQTRTVHALIRAVSVGSFGSASNYGTNQFGSQVWYTPDQQFNGPVYDGGPMHIQYDDKSTAAIFLSTVQTPNIPVWSDLQGGTTPTTSSDWASIISAGPSAFATGGNPIGLPVPQDNVLVASEAFYGDATSVTTTFPTCAAVCMNKGPAESGTGTLTTGIYISGNATISGTSAGSTETLTIKAASQTYQILIDFGKDTTTVTKNGVKGPTYSGVPSGDNGPGAGNGAIFDEGNATLQLGTVIQGDYVLTVPDYSAVQNNITLSGSGNITYNDPTKDELGLWANNVILNTSASNITIDASIIAGFPSESKTNGGFYNSRCNSSTCTAGNQGTLTLNGALMENMRGALGKFISQTPPVHVGFDRHINYDARLGSNPPPFYPVTGNYSIVAWDDEGN